MRRIITGIALTGTLGIAGALGVVGTAPAQAATGTYTAKQVAKHSTAANCWSIVGRNVYDLTAYVNRHPNGAADIVAMCGRNATSLYASAHAGDRRAASDLAAYRIGRLA